MEADLPENSCHTPALIWSPTGAEAGRPRPPRYDTFVAYCAAHCAESLVQHAGPAPWSVEAIHQWSISDLGSFWGAVADFFGVQWTQKPISIFESGPSFYQTQWFRGGKLSYAAQVMAQKTDQRPALVALEENGTERVVSWEALEQAAGRWQAKLRAAGVTQGDRVVAMARNTPETIAAFLAVNGLGAIWSSCAPEFGAEAIVDRCAQIEPKVFLYAPEYPYNGKVFDLKAKAQSLALMSTPRSIRVCSVSKVASAVALDMLTAWWSKLRRWLSSWLMLAPRPHRRLSSLSFRRISAYLRAKRPPWSIAFLETLLNGRGGATSSIHFSH